MTNSEINSRKISNCAVVLPALLYSKCSLSFFHHLFLHIVAKLKQDIESNILFPDYFSLQLM